MHRMPPSKAPSWRHVEHHDLVDARRLLTLYEQASGTGAVAESEMERLHFFTAAEHALAKGRRNPCGLFVHLVKHKRWNFCTERDEDLARQRLKRTLYGVTLARQQLPTPQRAPERPSDDARLAQAIHAVSVREGIPPLVLVRRMRPDWTFERYERALENARSPRRLAGPRRPPLPDALSPRRLDGGQKFERSESGSRGGPVYSRGEDLDADSWSVQCLSRRRG